MVLKRQCIRIVPNDLRPLALFVEGFLLLTLVSFNAPERLLAQPTPPIPIPAPVTSDAGCLIQSNFGSSAYKNFETFALQGNDLVHYWHDNANVHYTWVRGQVITHNATGPGCGIQSDFRSGDHGNFEVVVPEGNNLVHYWHDNSDVASPWHRGQVISNSATGPASIIQSDFRSGSHGNFEVVVLEGPHLVHYWHDNSDVNSPWRRGQTISERATSAASIIQSNFTSGDHGNFEVVVREGNDLVHYWHDNSNVNSPWRRGQTISTAAGGPAQIIQSDFRSGDHGNFEVVTTEGSSLVHYWHDNSDVNLPWRRGQTIANPANGFVGFVQSSFGSSNHGNFEVVAMTDATVVHHWHDNSDVNSAWNLGQVVTPSARSQKICQMTGDDDFQNRHETKNRTKTRFSVSGTDLGYPFEHDGRLYFLFGDTHGGADGGPDSLAFTLDSDPERCPLLTFVADDAIFRPIQAPGVSMSWFEVPTTGFSANGKLYAFVWTDHKDNFNGTFSNPVGHAALLRSDDSGRSFHLVWDRLGDKLVYLAAAVVHNVDIPDLPDGAGDGLLIFGSGKFYRKSNPYLAYVPLSEIENKQSIKYFAGLDPRTGKPRWLDESDAQPLFEHRCVGELSATWNSNLRQWLMLYNCDVPNGVVGRLADKPWGPWSDAEVIFDADKDAGSCYFIHGPGDCGPPSDPESPALPPDRLGGVYAPFVIPRYTKGGAGTTTIYYMMSTWNPYQVVLMRSTLVVRTDLPFPVIFAEDPVTNVDIATIIELTQMPLR